MIIGVNLAHDASAALTDSSGVVLSALAEERISRKKNHIGVPRKSLQELILNVELDKILLLHIVINVKSKISSFNLGKKLFGESLNFSIAQSKSSDKKIK